MSAERRQHQQLAGGIVDVHCGCQTKIEIVFSCFSCIAWLFTYLHIFTLYMYIWIFFFAILLCLIEVVYLEESSNTLTGCICCMSHILKNFLQLAGNANWYWVFKAMAWHQLLGGLDQLFVDPKPGFVIPERLSLLRSLQSSGLCRNRKAATHIHIGCYLLSSRKRVFTQT